MLNKIIDWEYVNVPNQIKSDFAKKMSTSERKICLEAMHSFAQQEVEKHVERIISEFGLSSGSIEAIRNTPIQITK